MIKRVLLWAAVSCVVATACTEKIDLPLKDSEAQVVIEGIVDNGAGPHYVLITKSKLYYENNDIERVTDAQVVIADDAGNVDTLTSLANGIYLTNSLQGVVGRTYYLSAKVGEVLYTAQCKMPAPVAIDSVVYAPDALDNDNLRPRVYFTDPAASDNFYRIISFVNDTATGGIQIHTDRLWNGKIRNYRVGGDPETGDTVKVNLVSITSNLYDYFRVLDTNDGFAQSAAPANPPIQYTPKALGYFSAQSYTTQSLIIP